MEKVIDQNYPLLLNTLDPQVLAPHLKAHLTVGGSSLYYQKVRDKEKIPQEQTMELLNKLRNKGDMKFWEEFVDICNKCGYTEVARIFKDGIKEARRQHKFPPQSRKPNEYKPKKEVEFRGSKSKFKDVMNHNWPQLLEMIDPDILVPLLKAQLTVGGNDRYYQQVTRPKVNHERNEILLDIIHKRKDLWKPFLDACQKCDYEDILEMFKEVRFDKDDAKNNGKNRSPPRSLTRQGSMSPKPEMNLSSGEDTMTVYDRTQSHGMVASASGGAHQSSNAEGTNQNATRGDRAVSLVGDKAYESMPNRTPKAEQLRNSHDMLGPKENTENIEGAGSTHQSDPRLRKANFLGNIDNNVKPEPGQKVIPTINLPNLDQILPSDSSHISETNERETSVRTGELFEAGQAKETPCQENGESDGTLYISTLTSSMFEDSPCSPKDWTGQGYRPEFLRSDCCDTSTDAEQLRDEALRKQEAMSENRRPFGHRNQQFNHKDKEPYEEENNSKGSGEPLPNDDVKNYERGENDADVSDGSESTQSDDQEHLAYDLEGHDHPVDEVEKHTSQNLGVTAGSAHFGPNQYGSHPEMRTDLESNKDSESRKHISNNRGVIAGSDEFGPNQHSGHPVNRISLEDDDETTTRKQIDQNAGVQSDSAQHGCFADFSSNLEENNNIASRKPTDRNGVKEDSAELGPEQHGCPQELAKSLQENNSSESKMGTNQNAENMVESVELIQNESRGSRLYRSIPFLLSTISETIKCTDVTQMFSLPIFTKTDQQNIGT